VDIICAQKKLAKSKENMIVSSKWFVIPKKISQPSLRIFCFPYAAGSASTYIPWAEKLPSSVELVAIQPPGRSTRIFEAPHDEMNSLVLELINEISLLEDCPCVFFGHSLGSRVAYEVMYQGMKRGLRLPEHFIASGSRAPFIPIRKDPIHDLPEVDFIDAISALNGTPKAILENDELMKLCLPLLRADFKIAELYEAKKAKFCCPVTVLGGEDDSDVTSADLLAWGDLFTSKPEINMLPGGHFFIENNKEMVINKVVSILTSTLIKLNLTSQPSYDMA
jgi:surfactin synthase thioesterase subunit